MARLSSNKRYILAITLGVVSFMATFYIAYAAFAQWTREQPAGVLGVAVEILGPGAMSLYTDEQLTNELTSNDLLEFSAPLLQPPLDNILHNLRAEREL
jgi:hypothetical protein